MKLSIVLAALKPFLATDAKVADIDAAVKVAMAADKAKDEAATKEAEAKAAKDEADKKATEDAAAAEAEDCSGEDDEMDADDADIDADDEAPESPVGGAKKPSGKDSKGKDKAMDAAVSAAVTAALTARDALHTAREEVKPILGVVKFDSAAQVYAEALKKVGIAVDGVHPSAYGALLRATVAAKSAPTQATDSATGAKPLQDAFKGYNRLSR